MVSHTEGLDVAGPMEPPARGLPTTRQGMLRYRVLPRSIIGISMLILSFAVGAGFSGVVLYSYYQYKQNQADTKVNTIISGYKAQFAKAEADLNADAANAKTQINNELESSQALAGGPSQAAALVKKLAPSVFFVHTSDAAGQPSVGTAFVVSSGNGQTLLLTSYTTVAAATRSPGPRVFVSQGNTGANVAVSVHSVDQSHDLALLVMNKTGYAPVPIAPANTGLQPGQPVYAVSGEGTAGASIVPGAVIDAFSGGVAVNTAVGQAFQGGPIINSTGQVIAVASRSYAPLGFASSGVYYSPRAQAACDQVLACPGGTLG